VASSTALTFTLTLGTAVAKNQQITVTIADGIDNPQDTGETGLFQIQTFNAAGTQLDKTTTGASLSGLEEGALTSLVFDPSTDEVGGNAILTVSFKTGNKIGTDGLILIEFPLWNPNREFSSQEKHYFEGSVSVQFLNEYRLGCFLFLL